MRSYLFAMSIILSVPTLELHSYEKASSVAQGALVEAQIHVDQGQEHGAEGGKFQPGFPVQIKAKVKNSGNAVTKANKIRVRYALPKPYSKNPNSILFETEVVDLAAMSPGEEKEVVFTKMHNLPVVADFVRYDWPMRQYQAILGEGDNEQIIGNLAITYSAYYYEGPGKALPVEPK